MVFDDNKKRGYGVDNLYSMSQRRNAMITITIKTDNAAFGDQPLIEVGRILRMLAEKAEEGELPTRIMDYNGNSVGNIDGD